jgi:molecular chaperone DnaK
VIYEGDAPVASENHLLDTVLLTNLPPTPAGGIKIKVHFSIDQDGLLVVSAQDQNDGASVAVDHEIRVSFRARNSERELEDLREASLAAQALFTSAPIQSAMHALTSAVYALEHGVLASQLGRSDIASLMREIAPLRAFIHRYATRFLF